MHFMRWHACANRDAFAAPHFGNFSNAAPPSCSTPRLPRRCDLRTAGPAWASRWRRGRVRWWSSWMRPHHQPPSPRPSRRPWRPHLRHLCARRTVGKRRGACVKTPRAVRRARRAPASPPSLGGSSPAPYPSSRAAGAASAAPAAARSRLCQGRTWCTATPCTFPSVRC